MDARGHALELWQYKGDGPSGPFDRIRYEYTPAGQIASVTDAAGNVRRYTYDQRGRQVKAEDPDSGTTERTYDELDRLTSSTDQRKIKTSTTYDTLGRKTNVYLGEAVTGTRLRSWTYDTVDKGQLYSAASYVDGKAYGVVYPTRDEFYRPLLTRYVIPDHAGAELKGVYQYSTSYNRDGTVQGLGLPAIPAAGMLAEGLTYTYDGLKRPTGMTGASTYVTDTKYAQTGALLQVELNTGGKKAWLSWTYEEGTNRLIRSRVDRQGAAAVDADASYRYDDAGNVLSIVDAPAGGDRDVQCFTHDWQRRLTEAWTSASTADDPCAGGPAATGVGGPAPYHHSYGYDSTGNRTGETRHGIDGAPDITRDYAYPDPGQAQPHTVQKVTEKNGQGAERTFTYIYDGAGNTTGRQLEGRSQTLDWDSDGRLAGVTEGTAKTTFVYDAEGNRLVRKESGATTVYLPGTELRLDHATRAVTATRYYTFGGRTVAVRSVAGMKFLAEDHHGTSHLAIDAVTGTVTRRRTTPFGDLRGAAPTVWPSERGFVGGIQDATGLVHLGAREYDPTIGRFVSPDPIVDLADPQQIHGYSYASNNPVTLSDSTGLMPDADGGSRKGGDNSSMHNFVLTAVFVMLVFIRLTLRLRGDITVDLGEGGTKANTIPRAARDGSGDDGVADLILDGPDVVYIWEVKPANAGGRDLGRTQLDRYIREKRAELIKADDHRKVLPGPTLPPISGIPYGDGKVINIWMEPRNKEADGLIFYGSEDAPKTPPPPERVPVPEPHPTPLPAPRPVQDPVRVPTTAPAPPGTGVLPHPNPAGPYGTCPGPGCVTDPGNRQHWQWDPPNVSGKDVASAATTAGVIVIGILWSILNPAAA
nr:RHS repeat-associated core domain-containing protein [Planosporangium mesophilum]